MAPKTGRWRQTKKWRGKGETALGQRCLRDRSVTRAEMAPRRETSHQAEQGSTQMHDMHRHAGCAGPGEPVIAGYWRAA